MIQAHSSVTCFLGMLSGQPSRRMFPRKKTRSIPTENGHLRPSRPRLVQARLKVCTRHVHEPLLLAKQEPASVCSPGSLPGASSHSNICSKGLDTFLQGLNFTSILLLIKDALASVFTPNSVPGSCFHKKNTCSIPAGNGHLKASRPRLAPARPKVCARRVREPLRFPKQEPFPLSPLGGVRVLAQWISTGRVFMINPRAQ